MTLPEFRANYEQQHPGVRLSKHQAQALFQNTQTTTHMAGCKMAFGRKDPNCPRCRELLNGAPPRQWAPSRAQLDAQRCREIRNHNCTVSRCGPVCTYGDW